jgi:PPM family protein phosphatase
MHQSRGHFRIAYRSDPGLLRRSNEDSVCADPVQGLFIVADGMGGHKGGEVASSIAVKEISRHIRRGLKTAKDAPALVREAFLVAHEAILKAAHQKPRLDGMGTTAVLALSMGHYFIIGHVGDSRAYLVRDSAMRPLTADHSFVAEWVREGKITAQQARTHKARHGITMALGADEELDPALSFVLWDEQSTLLLCSDGLTDMLEDWEILNIIQEADTAEDAVRNLVIMANRRGGADNITALLVTQ